MELHWMYMVRNRLSRRDIDFLKYFSLKRGGGLPPYLGS
jgi:hypothetical protein